MLRRRALATALSVLLTGFALSPGGAPARSAGPAAPPEPATVVTDWEQILLDTVYGQAAPKTPIPLGVPLLGYTSVAMYDGVKRAARIGGSQSAAVAQAAHDVAGHVLPGRRGRPRRRARSRAWPRFPTARRRPGASHAGRGRGGSHGRPGGGPPRRRGPSPTQRDPAPGVWQPSPTPVPRAVARVHGQAGREEADQGGRARPDHQRGVRVRLPGGQERRTSHRTPTGPTGRPRWRSSSTATPRLMVGQGLIGYLDAEPA